MDIKKLNENLIVFWNQQFKKLASESINKKDINVSNPLGQALVFLGNHCDRILDFGCGSGYGLFLSALTGNKIKYGLGIDTSKNAIKYCKETSKKSHLNHLDFVQANEDYL
ncbi:MAG TPA: class I SAM-dependent methyltransferase, partial [Candidatus Izemoplasmatales bacterium]|nr:class I SAM-dependent methyltransferase [Candidatus Izemoplasmatales bacterium]